MSAQSSLPPEIATEVPGPRSRALASRLAEVESRNVTCLAPHPPIFWDRASGANVWDVDGNRYLDLTAAFGVANVGHTHPAVVEAVSNQAGKLMHGMGDVHPSGVKVELLERLVARFPSGVPARAVLGSSGADAVEIALETAWLATGARGVIAFEGGYHGLSVGAREVTWRPAFRDPFAARLNGLTAFARFGDANDARRAEQRCAAPVGAICVEPIQGRGGERIPPDGFLRDLRALCDERGWLLIVDEIYTGFGRTGHFFACDYEGIVPDLLCVSKGLTSGMPLSACIGRREVMDAWPISRGEALRTQTFLGHPPSCAAALAALETLEQDKLVERSANHGAAALSLMQQLCEGRRSVVDVRGRGLLLAIELDDARRTDRACMQALHNGVITLQSGDDGSVISISPPLCIDRDSLELGIRIAMEAID